MSPRETTDIRPPSQSRNSTSFMSGWSWAMAAKVVLPAPCGPYTQIFMLRATSWTVNFLGIGTLLSCRRRHVILAVLALAVHRITIVVGVLTPKLGEAKLLVLAPPADPWRQR